MKSNKNHYLFFYIIYFCFLHVCVYAKEVDLEKYLSDFVIETRKIHIEEHPHAFNPSIIRWEGKLFMTFRELSSKLYGLHCAGESRLFIVRLDENFTPIEEPQELFLSSGHIPSPVEDGRLVIVNSRLYLVYSSNQEEEITNGGFRVYIAELEFDGSIFHIIHNECLANFEDQSPDVREKNWVPFDYDGSLLLAYTISPHKILYPLLDGSGRCETYISTRPSIVWEWGELRGGTPAIAIDDEYYLSFFHSSIELRTQHSKGKSSLHYFIGAYLFDLAPPYKIRRVSPEPIIGKNFYHGKEYDPYWNDVNVVFPCGFIIDDNWIWMTYGRQDHEVWVVKLNKKKLLESLIHVSSVKNSQKYTEAK